MENPTREVGHGAFRPEIGINLSTLPHGVLLLDSMIPLPPVMGGIPARLSYWAEKAPSRVFLSEKEDTLTYANAEVSRRRIAAALLGRMKAGRPLMIVAGNSINHALLMLGASSVGIPVAVISPSYAASQAAPWAKFAHVLRTVDPELVIAEDVPGIETALNALGLDLPVRPIHDLIWLEEHPSAPAHMVEEGERRVTPDSVAKLLFTSGSTGMPKAVPNTQRMMVSNMLALSSVWTFLNNTPPVLVDWLPWNHTFGGNCCFNIALWFGGHLHVDAGRPSPDRVSTTVEAIRTYRPNLYFNVPAGYEALLGPLEKDPELATRFLDDVTFLFSAGAPMSSDLRARLEALAQRTIGRIPPIVGGWGATETAPFSTILSFPTDHATNLGVPIPGTTIKLVPEGDRYELRVRGPNVMPGYWRHKEGDAGAFDEEGYYRTGDAGTLADSERPELGIVFQGRLAENFKLSSGTFVNVGALRLALVAAGGGLISDVVIAGEGRSDLVALVFPSARALSATALQSAIAERLRAYNGGATGSSLRIARFLLADDPPDANAGEITEKGYINQRRVLARRAELIERIYSAGIPLGPSGGGVAS